MSGQFGGVIHIWNSTRRVVGVAASPVFQVVGARLIMTRLSSRLTTLVASKTLVALTRLSTRLCVDAALALVETRVRRTPVRAHIAQRVAVVVLLHRRRLARTPAGTRAHPVVVRVRARAVVAVRILLTRRPRDQTLRVRHHTLTLV